MFGGVGKPELTRPAPMKSDNVRCSSGLPGLDDFITTRDFMGAVTLLEFQRSLRKEDALTLPWLGYAYFHLHRFEKSLQVYEDLLAGSDPDTMYYLYAAVNLFYLGRYEKAKERAMRGPPTRLRNRLLFHISHRKGDETELIKFHSKLSETIEDKLSLATVHYLRGHYQDATDIYKQLLIQDRKKHVAMHVYIGMCYYQLDYHDVSMEIINPYLAIEPDSIHSVNLLACNKFKLYNGKSAEVELKSIIEQTDKSNQSSLPDIIKHNLVVFREGENALAQLPPILDSIPEARLNLAIYYLKNGDYEDAYSLLKDLEPSTPIEYILKGVVSVSVGQVSNSSEHLKLAQQYFQMVGASTSECDTIPGRKCMASTFFLLQQFDDVLIYLDSINKYLSSDCTFNINFGVALTQAGRFEEGEQSLTSVQDEQFKASYCYISHLSKCFIMNSKAWQAWELYLKMETCTDSLNLLVLIANECYNVGSFYYSAKAFDVLERLDSAPEYSQGKHGACAGVLQMVLAGKETKESLLDVISMLRHGESDRSEKILAVISKWCEEQDIGF